MQQKSNKQIGSVKSSKVCVNIEPTKVGSFYCVQNQNRTDTFAQQHKTNVFPEHWFTNEVAELFNCFNVQRLAFRHDAEGKRID